MDIGAVEPVQEGLGRGALEQSVDNLGAGFLICGRGEGRKRHIQKALHLPDAQIIRPEIMPPLRDTMRLIHRDQGDPRAAHQMQGARGGEALGRDVEELERPRVNRRKDLFRLFLGIAGGQRPRFHAKFAQDRT